MLCGKCRIFVLVRHMVDTTLLAADGHTRPKSHWICQSSQRERLSSMWLPNTEMQDFHAFAEWLGRTNGSGGDIICDLSIPDPRQVGNTVKSSGSTPISVPSCSWRITFVSSFLIHPSSFTTAHSLPNSPTPSHTPRHRNAPTQTLWHSSVMMIL